MTRTYILNKVTRNRVMSELAYLDISSAYEVTVKPLPVRSAEQNRKMWACLQDISDQVEWYGQKYSKDDWKDILTAGLKKQRLVPGIDGGLVLVGSKTHNMSTQEMVELIEFALWFGSERGVKWGEENVLA